jgi:hypothetical protein
MPIRITCPHCKRGMLVDERLAGKKGRCKGCQQILTIPSLPTSNSSTNEAVKPAAPRQQAKPATPKAPAADVEAEAAALFSDEPKPTEPVETKTIDLNCPFCDEPIHFPVTEAGKRAPCPECKHIIKVPEPAKKDPKDWRKVEARGPAGARMPDQPALEGAWGSATAGRVGTQSLVEAGIIPKVEKPRTLWQRTRWPVLGVSLVLFLSLGGWGGYRWWSRRAIERGVQDAIAYAESPDSKPPVKSALAMAAGEYYLGKRESDSADKANKQLGKALNALRSASKEPEHDGLLADLALAQVELGGDKADADKGLRLPWDKTQQLLLATLREIQDEEAKLLAFHAVVGRLLQRGEGERVLPLTHQIYSGGDAEKAADKAVALSTVGLEFLQSGNRPKAERAAEDAINLYKVAKGNTKPPLCSEMVTLALLLDKKPPAAEEDGDKPFEHLGKVEALARQGKWDEARKLAAKDEFGEPTQFHARLAVAAAAVDAKESDRSDLDALLKLAESKLAATLEPSWPILRLTELALRGGVPPDQVQPVADKIRSRSVRGRAQLAVFRARLEQAKQAVEESAADTVNADTAAHGMARQALARHNTRLNGSCAAVQGWPQPDKSFGALGVALGLQDRRR